MFMELFYNGRFFTLCWRLLHSYTRAQVQRRLGAVTHFVDDDPLDNYIWSITIHLWTINLSERCFHWDDWLAFFPQLRSGFGWPEKKHWSALLYTFHAEVEGHLISFSQCSLFWLLPWLAWLLWPWDFSVLLKQPPAWRTRNNALFLSAECGWEKTPSI